jgi:pilus assembly protein CpaE
LEIIKVLVAGVETDVKEGISDALSNVEYISFSDAAETLEQAMEMLDQRHYDVVIADANTAGNGYAFTEKVTEQFSGVAVILVERELKEETMRAALFSGAKDVLLYPFTPSKLVNSIYQSYKAEKKKQGLQKGMSSAHQRRGLGQQITVFGTKGGIGKTFVATNLAVSLAQRKGNSVALVDLDLDFGNAALTLNIIPSFTISDVVNEISILDQDLMESYLIPHSSGVRLLASTAEPQTTEFITAEQISLILKILKNIFDYVVVDMPGRFYEPVDPALQEADLLLLVATPEVITLRNIRSCLNTLAHFKYPAAKIKLVLNKVDSRDDIKPRDVEATLNKKIYAALQADYRLVCTSMNQGIPMVTLYPRSKTSKGFSDLANLISGTKKGPKDRKEATATISEEAFQEVNR